MIVDVPDHRDLQDTGLNWLNLAWATTIDSLKDFKEYLEYYEDQGDEGMPPQQQDAYWQGQRYRLNNATALLQQSMEILLKARIAEVSPFLLLAGDPQRWRRPDENGNISFTDLRTLDATQLFSVATFVAATPLPSEFQAFFDDIRRRRNKIVHLNAGNLRVEAGSILLEILKAFRFLFPDQEWATIRRAHEEATMAATLGPWERNPAHSSFLSELRVVFETLAKADVKAFFGYDLGKKGLACPKCSSMQVKWDNEPAELAQRRADKSVYCVGCGGIFTPSEYAKECVDYFGD